MKAVIKTLCDDIYGCRNLLRLQLYLYAADLLTSLTVIYYLLYTRREYSLLTIQLSTLAMIPSTFAVIYVTLYNWKIGQLESTYWMDTGLKVGVGFKDLSSV